MWTLTLSHSQTPHCRRGFPNSCLDMPQDKNGTITNPTCDIMYMITHLYHTHDFIDRIRPYFWHTNKQFSGKRNKKQNESSEHSWQSVPALFGGCKGRPGAVVRVVARFRFKFGFGLCVCCCWDDFHFITSPQGQLRRAFSQGGLLSGWLGVRAFQTRYPIAFFPSLRNEKKETQTHGETEPNKGRTPFMPWMLELKYDIWNSVCLHVKSIIGLTPTSFHPVNLILNKATIATY